MMMKLAILGSTGSIGRQTLDVVRQFPEQFSIVALAAGNNLDLLEQQVQEFQPSLVSTSTPVDSARFTPCDVLCSDEGLSAVATHPDADILVVATSGHSAIKPTLDAVRAGKQIALANKEAVVCAGEMLIPAADESGIAIRPVDSEHSAIWQCLMARGGGNDIAKITITSSGGALRDFAAEKLPHATVEQALAHPNWAMGPKVTIDSATLMNKGLEVIEAHWLFRTSYEQIDVVIHPQSLVHSLVTFIDGSTIAQLGIPDMRIPIQYALSHPERLSAPDRLLDIAGMRTLEFREPDRSRYPALDLAYEAGRAGSTFPTVLSTVDEIAVDAFLLSEIPFGAIAELVERVLNQHQPESGALTLDAIHHADAWARAATNRLIESLRS